MIGCRIHAPAPALVSEFFLGSGPASDGKTGVETSNRLEGARHSDVG